VQNNLFEFGIEKKLRFGLQFEFVSLWFEKSGSV